MPNCTLTHFVETHNRWALPVHNTLVNSKGVGIEVRVKEPVLAIDKHVPSPTGTLLEAMYDS